MKEKQNERKIKERKRERKREKESLIETRYNSVKSNKSR